MEEYFNASLEEMGYSIDKYGYYRKNFNLYLSSIKISRSNPGFFLFVRYDPIRTGLNGIEFRVYSFEALEMIISDADQYISYMEDVGKIMCSTDLVFSDITKDVAYDYVKDKSISSGIVNNLLNDEGLVLFEIKYNLNSKSVGILFISTSSCSFFFFKDENSLFPIESLSSMGVRELQELKNKLITNKQ